MNEVKQPTQSEVSTLITKLEIRLGENNLLFWKYGKHRWFKRWKLRRENRKLERDIEMLEQYWYSVKEIE
jgi:hypothetical protein